MIHWEWLFLLIPAWLIGAISLIAINGPEDLTLLLRSWASWPLESWRRKEKYEILALRIQVQNLKELLDECKQRDAGNSSKP